MSTTTTTTTTNPNKNKAITIWLLHHLQAYVFSSPNINRPPKHYERRTCCTYFHIEILGKNNNDVLMASSVTHRKDLEGSLEWYVVLSYP